jgi:hypothetical protein
LQAVVLFGGYQATYVQSLNDTWLWNGTAWTEAEPLKSPFAAVQFGDGLRTEPRAADGFRRTQSATVARCFLVDPVLGL